MKAIAAGVFRSAAQIIENQGNTPVSPCEVDPDGSVRLCAAAALAVAGVRLYEGQKSVGLLLEKLVAQPDRNLIRATFARFGWEYGGLRYEDAIERFALSCYSADSYRQSFQ
jgi:hypothetical protein